jgi:hypothetical protein
MSEQDFDSGYYEGIRDALNLLLIMHMEGATLPEIRERLVNMRANAKVTVEFHDEADEDYQMELDEKDQNPYGMG